MSKENPLNVPSEIVDRHLREKSTLPIIIPSIMGRRVSRRNVIIKTGEIATGLLIATTGLIGEEVSAEKVREQVDSTPKLNADVLNNRILLLLKQKKQEENTKPPSNKTKISLLIAGAIFIVDGVRRNTPITYLLPRRNRATSRVR